MSSLLLHSYITALYFNRGGRETWVNRSQYLLIIHASGPILIWDFIPNSFDTLSYWIQLRKRLIFMFHIIDIYLYYYKLNPRKGRSIYIIIFLSSSLLQPYIIMGYIRIKISKRLEYKAKREKIEVNSLQFFIFILISIEYLFIIRSFCPFVL